MTHEISATDHRPRSLLICAMGGEGGGVLTGWIVAAAQAEGLAVQATSVPGVAQRTGGTTYYIEMAKRDAAGRSPIFALTPVPGEVDVVLASELAEAARAVRLGFVTPERTDLIASTHRVFLIEEKMAMADGRIDPSALAATVRRRARQAKLLDMEAVARESGAPISAVMLGALAGAQVLPIARQQFEAAIRSSGIAVEKNLQAFATAITTESVAPAEVAVAPDQPDTLKDQRTNPFIIDRRPGRAEQTEALPASARGIVQAAEQRLIDYQDEAYAALYRSRLEAFATHDPELVRELARHLALRMSYEDVIRVAQLKARPERFERIRDELGLDSDEPFEVRDFFKPGVNEIADILSPRMARWLLARVEANPRFGRWHVGMQLRSTTISGYLRLLFLARMRGRRPRTYRYANEQAAIDAWLALVRRAAKSGDTALAREITELARLIKGYGDTHARGTQNFDRIVAHVVEPALAQLPSETAAQRVRAAREAALADPDGDTLSRVLAQTAEIAPPASPPEQAATVSSAPT